MDALQGRSSMGAPQGRERGPYQRQAGRVRCSGEQGMGEGGRECAPRAAWTGAPRRSTRQRLRRRVPFAGLGRRRRTWRRGLALCPVLACSPQALRSQLQLQLWQLMQACVRQLRVPHVPSATRLQVKVQVPVAGHARLSTGPGAPQPMV